MVGSSLKRGRSQKVDKPPSQAKKSKRTKSLVDTSGAEEDQPIESDQTQYKLPIITMGAPMDTADISTATDVEKVPRKKLPNGQQAKRQSARVVEKKGAAKSLEKLYLLPHDQQPQFDYDTRGGDWSKHLQEYMMSLDAVAKFANPGYEEMRNDLALLAGNPKDSAQQVAIRAEFRARQSRMARKKTLNVAWSSEELDELLKEAFDEPIYIPASSELGAESAARDAKSDNYTLDRVWNLIDERQSVECQQQHLKDAPKIHSIPKAKAMLAFRKGLTNILELDLINDDGNCLKPRELKEADRLETLISYAPQSANRRDEIGGKNLRRFFLLSSAHTASTSHVDSGGLLTWVRCLEGSKWWYWAAPITHLCPDDKANLLDPAGDYHDPCMLKQPWSKIQLLPGDILIMPSGMVHAVYTPQDALFIGGFALTDAMMHQSMAVMSIMCNADHLLNDETPPKMFEYLKNYFHTRVAGADSKNPQRIAQFRQALVDFCRTLHTVDTYDQQIDFAGKITTQGNPSAASASKSRPKKTTRVRNVAEEGAGETVSAPYGRQPSIEVGLLSACKGFVQQIKDEQWVQRLDRKLRELKKR